MDNDAKGMMVGLSINTQSQDISKAILEGITFEMMLNLDRLSQAGISISELRAVGGLCQIRWISSAEKRYDGPGYFHFGGIGSRNRGSSDFSRRGMRLIWFCRGGGKLFGAQKEGV